LIAKEMGWCLLTHALEKKIKNKKKEDSSVFHNFQKFQN
jgi:hypothetical protein